MRSSSETSMKFDRNSTTEKSDDKLSVSSSTECHSLSGRNGEIMRSFGLLFQSYRKAHFMMPIRATSQCNLHYPRRVFSHWTSDSIRLSLQSTPRFLPGMTVLY